MITSRSARLARLGVGPGLIATLLMACSSSGPLHVENATDVDVAVYTDGTWVGTYAAGSAGDAALSGRGRPQTLEVRSPSGAVLLSMVVNDDQLAAAAAGRYGNASSVGLPCGVVTVLIGELGPDEALAPAEAVPAGPCP